MKFVCEMEGLNHVTKEDFSIFFTDVVSRNHVALLKKNLWTLPNFTLLCCYLIGKVLIQNEDTFKTKKLNKSTESYLPGRLYCEIWSGISISCSTWSIWKKFERKSDFNDQEKVADIPTRKTRSDQQKSVYFWCRNFSQWRGWWFCSLCSKFESSFSEGLKKRGCDLKQTEVDKKLLNVKNMIELIVLQERLNILKKWTKRPLGNQWWIRKTIHCWLFWIRFHIMALQSFRSVFYKISNLVFIWKQMELSSKKWKWKVKTLTKIFEFRNFQRSCQKISERSHRM